MGHNNGQELQMLLMMARRGSLIFASRTVRRFISHFYTAVTEPWGWTHGTDGIPANNFVTNAGSFTWDETNGGVGLGESRLNIAAVIWVGSCQEPQCQRDGRCGQARATWTWTS